MGAASQATSLTSAREQPSHSNGKEARNIGLLTLSWGTYRPHDEGGVTAMQEPFLSRFRNLIQQGAAQQDIHDTASHDGYAVTRRGASGVFINREVLRVDAHRKSWVPLLEYFVGPVASALDVGCGSGGTTVALALSPTLRPERVVGIDPNGLSIEAARVRAQGYELSPERVCFKCVIPGAPLPFIDAQFSLTVCVSVLEFISTRDRRNFLASEMIRVTEPGGFIFLATPSPFRLRELHSRRLLGDLHHREGYPWSSTPWEIRCMFKKCSRFPIHAFLVPHTAKRLGIRGAKLLSPLSRMLCFMMPWQKYLFQKK
jgi:SAM-dependent methyltransferase